MYRSIVLTVTLVALLATPASVAGWLSYGEREPSTTYDVAAARNFVAPDTSAWNAGGASIFKVYFNMFQGMYVTSANPNVGAAGTRILDQPVGHYEALLGVWKDCNKDGYIGQAESAVREYRSELLSDASVCPAQTSTSGALVFNDGRWVNEFVAIGSADPCSFEDQTVRDAQCGGIGAFRASPTTVNVNDTRVWYDFGVPGDGAGPGVCPINPQPRGTYERTGGIISYIECFRGYQELHAFSDLVDSHGDPGGLAFDDPANPMCDRSALNPTPPVNLFGDPCTGKSGLLQYGSNDPAFTVFDCQKGTTYDPVHENGWADGVHVDAKDPTKSAVDLGRVDPAKITVDPTDNRTVAPRVGSGIGSYVDAIANVVEGVGQGTPGGATSAGDCDPSDGGDAAFLAAQVDREGPVASRVAGRAANTDHMTFIGASRGGKFGDVVPFGLGPDLGLPTDAAGNQATDAWNGTAGATLGDRFSGDAGTGFCRFICGVAGTNTGEIWAGAFNVVQTQLFGPTTLHRDPVSYVTAYAHVGDEIGAYGLQLRDPTPSLYGDQNCGGFGPGALPENGWICDPTLWYKDATGKDIEAYSAGGKAHGVPLQARAGDPYQLVDVDCEDGHLATVAGIEVQASLTRLDDPTDNGPNAQGAVCKSA